MKALSKLKKTVVAGIMVAMLVFHGNSGVAEAGNCYKPVCYRYVKVVTYKTCRQAISRWVTIEDECGNRERIKVVFYRTIRVPVVYWVKVPVVNRVETCR